MRLLFIGILSVFIISAAKAAPPMEKPNIIVYISDDHSRDDSGPYGNKVVRTPNLDALANESLQFSKAFAASPSCTPSRSALLTGLFPMRNGGHANHGKVTDGIKTWPHYFKELGYRVVLAGKTHFNPRNAFPFEYVQADVDPKAPPLEHVLDAKAVDKLLREHAAQHREPLCLIVADYNPHVVWAQNDGYDPAKVVLPPYLVDTKETREALTRYYTDISLMDKTLGDCLTSMKKHGFADALFVHTSDQGAQFPHAKWCLYDAGLGVPFFVRWPGKVKPGKSDAMISLIDLLPTLLEAAGANPPKEIDGKSFLPVLLGKKKDARDAIFAAHTADIYFKPAGNELWEFPARGIRTERYKYILNLHPERKFKTHVTDAEGRDGRDYWNSWLEKAKTDPNAQTLIYNFQNRPAEELYDLRKDPFELHNVAGDPKNEKTLKSLRGQLLAWMKQQGEKEPEILRKK